MKEIEAQIFSDGSWVIMGAHLSIEESQKIYEKSDEGKVTNVEHFWVKYQRVSEERASLEFDLDDYSGGLWVVHESTNRPKGIVRRATVLTID